MFIEKGWKSIAVPRYLHLERAMNDEFSTSVFSPYIMLKKACYLFLFLLTLTSLTAQEDQPSFKHITAENGLSNNWVKAILKDKDGFMWFGTFNGLNRYDGNHFKIFLAGLNSTLSDNIIECLAEDQDGNLWVGTFSGGLHRFDRNTETFVQFQHDPQAQRSLSHNRICSIYSDHNGRLWIGTGAGLDLYHPEDNTFEHFLHNPDDPNSVTTGLVSCVYEDHTGRLWIGTEGGLNSYVTEEKKFIHYRHQPADPNSLAEDYVKSIYGDKYGHLWLGTWGGGLDKLEPETNTFHHFQNSQNSPWALSNNSVLALTGNNEDLIYIATEGGGLNIFDIQQEHFTPLLSDITNARSINSNSVHTLYYDDQNGMLWAGTYNGGVNYFSKWDKPFNLYQARMQGLNNNHVTSVAEDHNGSLWIGTDGGGINKMNPANGLFTYYSKAESGKDGLQSNAVMSLMCDQDNMIWVGTYNGGLDMINPTSGLITHYTHRPNDAKSLSEKNVSAIYEDKRGNIWAGTMIGGLNLFDRKTLTFTSYRHDPADTESIVDNFIYGIYEDRLGRLLVQTGKGLEIFDYKTGRFERYNPKLTTDLGVPVTLLEDSQGTLWVGSQERGLFRMDRTGVKATRYTNEDGLPDNSISGILEDESGNLWISTQRGLCKFEEAVINHEKVNFQKYSVEDGLQGSEFKRGAFCKTKNGLMVFGGQNGFNVFDPMRIKVNPFVPPVEITGFKIFNKEVDFSKGEVLKVPITETAEIRLPHHESVFTFDFSALSYMLPEKNKYAYMMEGFEETWNEVGTQRSATYSNLDAGEYYFNVKAANNDGIWNDTGTRIKIIIVPPWWEHMLFRIGLVLLLISSVVLYLRLRTNYLKRSKRELENLVALSTKDLNHAKTIIEERQQEIMHQNEILINKNNALETQSAEMKDMAKEINELTEAKIKFLANVSHELDTPLKVILNESRELNEKLDESDPLAEKHSIIYSNARKLFKLINQLLDQREVALPAVVRNESEPVVDTKAFTDEAEEGRRPAPFILVIESETNSNDAHDLKLSSTYQIEYAKTGADGLQKATLLMPDLIIADAHLPDMDGLILSDLLKKDEQTSHIPIILMMSRTDAEHLEESRQVGVDDYITKPFQPDLLELKIKNIFFTRQKLKEMFLEGALTMPDQFNMSAVDKQFLKNATKAVHENLHQSGFGVDEFSSYFGMSKRNVLRKMKGITGLSINEYIRNTRLKEAYAMLTKGDQNVSEVAYTVGFTDPKYFSNCFKKLYGKLPSEVRTVANTP